MKPRILVIAGLSLAVVIIAAAVVLNLMTGEANTTLATTPPGSSASSAAAGTPPVAGTPSAAGSEAAGSDDAAGSSAAGSEKAAGPGSEPATAAPADPKAPAITPDPNRPLEVLAPPAESTPATLPKSREDGPLLKLPLPGEASANGELVAGFPSSAVPLAPSASVQSSSVSPQDSILQLSLVANTSAEPLAVMAFYQKHFSALGLGAAQAPASTGSSAMWFTRGTDKITVTATPHPGGGTEYSVFGVLHAGS